MAGLGSNPDSQVEVEHDRRRKPSALSLATPPPHESVRVVASPPGRASAGLNPVPEVGGEPSPLVLSSPSQGLLRRDVQRHPPSGQGAVYDARIGAFVDSAAPHGIALRALSISLNSQNGVYDDGAGAFVLHSPAMPTGTATTWTLLLGAPPEEESQPVGDDPCAGLDEKVAELVALFEDQDYDVREAARKALVELATKCPDVLFLIEKMKEMEENQVEQRPETIGLLGESLNALIALSNLFHSIRYQREMVASAEFGEGELLRTTGTRVWELACTWRDLILSMPPVCGDIVAEVLPLLKDICDWVEERDQGGNPRADGLAQMLTAAENAAPMMDRLSNCLEKHV